MTKILMNKHIDVIEDNNQFGYHIMKTKTGEPYYVPDNPIEFEEGVNSDSAIILPISINSFLNKHRARYIGFRIRFDSASHTTVSLGIDPLNLSWTEIQIEKSISRFIYQIDSNFHIVIKEVKDPMYEPENHHIILPSQLLGPMLLSWFDDELTKSVSWVMHHEI